MHSGKLIFAQLMEHLPLHTFRRCVAKYPGRYPALTFSHLDQFLCMAFAQLTYRESLRDIETCLRAQSAKLYHLGIRGGIARSPRRLWRGVDEHCLRARLDDHRPVPRAVPVGEVPPGQGRGQAAHPARPARQYPELHPHHGGQAPRREHPRPDCLRGGKLLCHGPGLHRLRPDPHLAPGASLLRREGQVEPAIPVGLFAPRRQGDRLALRPDRSVDHTQKWLRARAAWMVVAWMPCACHWAICPRQGSRVETQLTGNPSRQSNRTAKVASSGSGASGDSQPRPAATLRTLATFLRPMALDRV